MSTIAVDPGHGMDNRRIGVFDSGAESNGVTEATIVMDWANELRTILKAAGHTVVRTRRDHADPAPVGKRAGIAKEHGCTVMLSLHCNAANGQASGTETFYRGDSNKAFASAVNTVVVDALKTKNRGVKTEGQSQHSRLAVLNFPRCVLLEIGFIDNASDRAKMLDPVLRKRACEGLAKVLVAVA